MPRLLIVHHSPSANLQSILDAVVAGASDDAIEGIEVVARPALEATIDDVLGADGYVLGTSANIGYISGALKHFFDTTFDVASHETQKRPFGYYIHGRSDTSGAERAMESITTGLKWRQVVEPLCFLGEPDQTHLDTAYELGGAVAATLMSTVEHRTPGGRP